jgi:hypothetical protein
MDVKSVKFSNRRIFLQNDFKKYIKKFHSANSQGDVGHRVPNGESHEQAVKYMFTATPYYLVYKIYWRGKNQKVVHHAVEGRQGNKLGINEEIDVAL